MPFINIKLGKIKIEDKVVIVLALILVIITFSIVYLTFSSEVTQQSQQSPSTLTPTPFASKSLLNYVKTTIVLSKSDSDAKAKLLSLLPTGDVPEVIYQSSDFSVEYVSSADIFLVAIQTTNIQSVKNEADAWFQNNGISQMGLCTLPVEFYLSPSVANKLRNINGTFNPLPNGC